MTKSTGRGPFKARRHPGFHLMAFPRVKPFLGAIIPVRFPPAPLNSRRRLTEGPGKGRGRFQATLHPYGGGERNRTDDLLLAKQALSQLSYTPLRRKLRFKRPKRGKWWAREDLNLRPHAYQARALTN